jgi:murein lipoprotein
MKTASTRTLVMLAASGLLFGCATVQQKDLQTQLDQVRAVAEKAAADAAAAQSRADAAMDTAASAKAQSEQTEAKIDRMFKKAMYK